MNPPLSSSRKKLLESKEESVMAKQRVVGASPEHEAEI